MESSSTSGSQGAVPESGPSSWGLVNRPRTPPNQSFRAFLQTLAGDEPRGPRSFGGLRSVSRCERATPDLLFLFYDGAPITAGRSLPERVLEAAEEFGYTVQVDQIERREETGRDVYGVREITGRAFGLRPRRAS